MRRTGQEDSGRQPPESPLYRDASRRQEPCLVGQAPLIALLLVSGPTLLSWPCHSHSLTAWLHFGRYPGVIIHTDRDMKYATIKYDDGEVEEAVLAKYIRRLDPLP